MIGAVALIVTLGFALWILRPRLAQSDFWRALATPLASIIGSGFLVSVPILRDLYGSGAVVAMAGLLTLAYGVGAAVRENIQHVEPLMENHHTGLSVASLERLSHLVLAFAYFVSVAYYLVLFATFLLKPFGIDDPLLVKWLVTALLAAIGGIGLWRGFRAVEGLEIYAVSLKLAVIAGVVVGLGAYAVFQWFDGPRTPIPPARFEVSSLPALLGLLILVQGFETSRFLGDNYDPALRVRSMKAAQAIAAGIYLAFFIVMTPILGNASNGHGVAAIVDMLAPVSAVLPLLIIGGALASQSSAAIADTLGAGGLVHDLARRQIRLEHTYPLVALVAAFVVWETNVYTLIAFASRCFAAYYGLQCLIATLSTLRRGNRWKAAGFAVLGALCAGIVVIGAPAEGA